MAGYRAIRINSTQTNNPEMADGYTYTDSGIRKFHKRMYEYIANNFNGFTKIGDWEDVGTGWIETDKMDKLSFRGYFSLDDTTTKQLKLYDYIVTEGRWINGGADFDIDAYHVLDKFGIVNPDNSDLSFDGIYTYGEHYIYYDFSHSMGSWYGNGYYHWLMVYVDDNDTVIGLSAFQSSDATWREDVQAPGIGGVMLFDRTNKIVYTTHSCYGNNITPSPWIAKYIGDLVPKNTFVYSGKSWADGTGIGLQEPIIYKNIVDDFVSFDNPFGLICLKSEETLPRLNQLIQIGDQKYIHLGGGNSGLYLPVKSNMETVYIQVSIDTPPGHPDLPLSI